MKKSFLLLILLSLIIACQTNSNQNTETVSNCDKSSEDYKYGYEAGHTQGVMVSSGQGGTSDVEVYISQMNNGNGAIGTINDCWKEGFNAGYKEAGKTKSEENINNSTTNPTAKSFNEVQLTLTDASVKKAKLFLGPPDKEEYDFGHITKGFSIYFDKVTDNGTTKDLVLYTRMNGDYWGDDAKIEEIYAITDNEKACFGIHCLSIENNQIHTNVASLKY